MNSEPKNLQPCQGSAPGLDVVATAIGSREKEEETSIIMLGMLPLLLLLLLLLDKFEFTTLFKFSGGRPVECLPFRRHFGAGAAVETCGD